MSKVMYLLEYPIDLPGGAQMSTQSLCQGLRKARAGIEPVVVCPSLLEKSKEDYPYSVITYKAYENRENRKIVRFWNLILRIFAYREIINKVKPDIVHIQMPESAIAYGILKTFGLFPNIKYVFTDRGLYYGYRKHSISLLCYSLKYGDQILCTTKLNKNLWLENTNFSNIALISNTISDEFEEFREEKRREVRKRQGYGENDFVLGFAGRVCQEKNWPLVQKICRALTDRKIHYKVELVMAVFEQGDEEVVKEVRKGIEECIGKENLCYHQDLSQSEMADYYYAVDVFLMTSKFESFGKAAVEAMSRKCAIISTKAGGLVEVVGKEENLYEVDNIKKCVDYIEELERNREKLKEEKAFFYERYEKNYSQKKCLKEHILLYEKLLRKD